MAIVVPNAGELLLLDQLLAYLDGCTIHLYQNNYTPIATTTLANLTEATFDSYTSQALGPWGATYTDGLGHARTDHAIVSWTASGGVTPNTIYGYYVTDSGGNLVYAERNPNGGQTINAAGMIYAVLPSFSAWS